MISYYTKVQNKIYRFRSWDQLSDFTGKDRSCFQSRSFLKAIRQTFDNARTISKWAAFNEGWINELDQPRLPYEKGNQNWL